MAEVTTRMTVPVPKTSIDSPMQTSNKSNLTTESAPDSTTVLPTSPQTETTSTKIMAEVATTMTVPVPKTSMNSAIQTIQKLGLSMNFQRPSDENDQLD